MSDPEPVFVFEGGVLHPVSYEFDPDDAALSQQDEARERRAAATESEMKHLTRTQRLYRRNANLQATIANLQHEITTCERQKNQQGAVHKEELEGKSAEIRQLIDEKIDLLQSDVQLRCQISANELYQREKETQARLAQQNAENGSNENSQFQKKPDLAEKTAIAIPEHYGQFILKSERQRRELEANQKTMASQNDRIKELQSDNGQKSDQLTVSRHETDSLLTRFVKMEESNVSLRDVLQKCDEDNAELEVENAQLKTDKAQWKVENAQLKADKAELKEENTQLKGEITVLRGEIAELKRKLGDL